MNTDLIEDKSNKPRFSFEITESQRMRALNVFTTYGLRKAVFSPILDEILDLVEKHGHIVLGVLIDPETKPKEVIPSIAKAERRVSR